MSSDFTFLKFLNLLSRRSLVSAAYGSDTSTESHSSDSEDSHKSESSESSAEPDSSSSDGCENSVSETCLRLRARRLARRRAAWLRGAGSTRNLFPKLREVRLYDDSDDSSLKSVRCCAYIDGYHCLGRKWNPVGKLCSSTSGSPPGTGILILG